MKDSLQPGLEFRFTYTVPANRTVPHLYPESPAFVAKLAGKRLQAGG